MPTINSDGIGGPSVAAFLDTIAFSEGTYNIGDEGYNVIVGSTPRKPILFTDYKRHPNKVIQLIIKGRTINSSAAGRYQLLYRYWVAYSVQLKLANFGKINQDRIALQQMRERGAVAMLKQNDFYGAVKAVSSIWASFPGAGYQQHEQKIEALAQAYMAAGGIIVGKT